MFLLLLLSMLIGWLIGGPDRESRRVLATSTGMRSVIVVLYVARYCFPGTNVYYDPDCLPVADGAHEPALPSGVHRMAQTAASCVAGYRTFRALLNVAELCRPHVPGQCVPELRRPHATIFLRCCRILTWAEMLG